VRTKTPRNEPLTISLMTSWAAAKFQVSGFQRGTAEPKIGIDAAERDRRDGEERDDEEATSQIVPGEGEGGPEALGVRLAALAPGHVSQP
jgi:hypothetical protein